MVSKLRAARVRKSVFNLEKAISIEIGRKGWQEKEPSAAGFDEVFGLFAFVKADIVENDDVSRRQGRRKLCFDPSLGDAPVHRCIDNPRRNHATRSQTGDEGLGFPRAEGRVCAVASAFLRPS